MPITRRELVKTGVAAAAALVVPRPLWVRLGARPEPVASIDDPRLEALVQRALDAARGAGAAYADVRLTRTRTRAAGSVGLLADRDEIAAGVRALVSGYWGFAASTDWSPDEMVRLGREATHEARVSALGPRRAAALAPAPVVARGHWVMPVAIDPFEVSVDEMRDTLDSLAIYTLRTPGAQVVRNDCTAVVQDEAFGSSEGSYFTRRTYRMAGRFAFGLTKDGRWAQGGLDDVLSPAGVGWEMYRNAPLQELIRRAIDEAEAELALPEKPVTVGRYDAVLDAASVAVLIHETLGPATELDRALGLEADGAGTSYVDDPLAMLGAYRAGSPLLTLTGNRTEPGGCATVAWDDEGVAPDALTLVQDGVLTDFQTTRESATWLADYYAKSGRPVRSHGCASAPSAMFAPVQHAPNLVLAARGSAASFDALVADVASGVAVAGMRLDMDFERRDGLAEGRVYEVKRGKRVARLTGAGLLIRAPQMWTTLRALGGSRSAARYGLVSTKGEPGQRTYASVTAPPAIFEQVTVIDPRAKA